MVTDAPATTASSDAAPVSPRARSKLRGWRATGLIVAVVAACATAWWLRNSAWTVNPDASAYLALALKLRQGGGFSLPDGTPFLNRPLYPTLVSLPWFVGPVSVSTAFWASRIGVALSAVVIGLMVQRRTSNLVAAIVAAALAFVQPWTAVTGTQSLVPDGLMATFTVTANALALAALAATGRRRWWLFAATAAACAGAFLTKETGVAAIITVALLVLHQSRPRVAAALVPFAFVFMFAGLVIMGGPIRTPIGTLPRLVHEGLYNQIFRNEVFLIVGLLVFLAAIIWTARNFRDALSFSGLVLMTLGAATGLYALCLGWNSRNGALFPLGFAIIAGAFVARARLWSKTVRTVTAIALALLFSVNFWAGTLPEDCPGCVGWDVPPARAAATWLHKNAAGQPITCTVPFCWQVLFDADNSLKMSLVPTYGAPLGPRAFQDLDFSQQADWWAWTNIAPARTEFPIGISRNRERFIAYFEPQLLDELRSSKSKYLLVAGRGQRGFDGANLLPYLEANPSFKRVFTSSPKDLPSWSVIYEVVGPLEHRPFPTTVSPLVNESLPDKQPLTEVVVAGIPSRNALLLSVLTEPQLTAR